MLEDLRFDAIIVKNDGSEKVINSAVTAEKYDRIEKRLTMLHKRGVATDLRLKYKVVRI